MSQAIGRNGLAAASPGDADTVVATFPLTTSVTKVFGLDPTKNYKMFSSVAGASDVTISVTHDSPKSIKAGHATWNTGRQYATLTGTNDNYLGAIKAGATGIKITHVKNGSVADNLGKTTTLGGRCQIRVVPGGDGTDEAGIVDYTPVASV